MLPLRLETKIATRQVDATDEPERVLDAFKELQSILLGLHNVITKKSIGEEDEAAVKALKTQICSSICEFEKIDLLYSEDKALLTDLTKNIYEALGTVELQDAFSPLFDTLNDITRLTTRSDKYATNFLRDLERVTRLLENTASKPMFCGKKRAKFPSLYSQTACFRVANKRYKEVNNWFENRNGKTKIEVMAANIQAGVITKIQCSKFRRLITRIKNVLNGTSSDSTVLTSIYPFDASGLSFDDIIGKNKNLNDIQPASLRNKCFHYKQLLNTANTLYDNINAFVNKDYDRVMRILSGKIVITKERYKKQLCPTRYSLLVAKMMNAELSLIKACGSVNALRRSHIRDAYRRLGNIKAICKTTYFNYEDQRDFVKELLASIIEIQKDCNAKRDIEKRYAKAIDKCKVTNIGSLHSLRSHRSLCLRIYPDVVALTQTAKQISREEYLAGKDFWLKYIYNNDHGFRYSLWLAMCDIFPPHRAAFILKRTFPKDTYSVMCRKAKEWHDAQLSIEDFIKEIDDNFVNSFPTTYVDNGENLFCVPVTNLMPDRFVVYASFKTKKNATRTIVQYGHRLPKRLQVGIDLNNLDSATEVRTVGNDKQLYLNGGVSWMTDYDEAERLGMAVTIPLDAFSRGRESFEFSQIFVYGINDADDDMASRMIEDMLTTHLYSDKAMDVIPFDTASNILTDDDAKDAFDSSEEAQRERFRHQAHNCVKPHKPEKDNDLDLLDRLFCLKESVLGNVDVPDEHGAAEVKLQRMVNKLMIEYMTKPCMYPMINPLLKAIKDTPALHEFLCKDVLPRGPFPMIRISDQPYGILPACDFKKLAVRKSNPLSVVKKILLVLTAHWNNILSENIVSCYGKDSANDDTTITTQDYLSILGNTPRSTSFFKRKTVKGGMIDAEYFRGEVFQHQIDELYNIARELNIIGDDADKEVIKSVIPDYDHVPVINLKGSDNAEDSCFTPLKENLQLDNIVGEVKKGICDFNAKNTDGIVLSTDDEVIKSLIIEFFDLFNYRLDAWLMGILNNKLRRRMESGRHRIALGCFGWIFNLNEKGDIVNGNGTSEYGCTDEYIIAPSINQAITAAIMRSSYVNSLKNGEARNYDMSVNLSSERVRSAIRIIEGIQNGLSLGAILGADMERLIHEAYKIDPDLELDSCIYMLRQAFPLSSKEKEETEESVENSPANITVMNGALFLEEYAKCKDDKDKVRKWLKGNVDSNSKFKLFDGDAKQAKKIEHLIKIIDVIDDEKDALTDVVLTESVYKLTQGNTEASHAISRALSELKNIPMPEVAEIPITSAQIDGHMVAMLPANAEYSESKNLLTSTEPKIEAWLRQMMYRPEEVCMQVVEDGATGDSLSLGELGISSAEMVYLSADKASFTHFVEVLSWMKTGRYQTISCDMNMVELRDDIHAFCECAMVIDDIRKILASAHAIKNDDLVKQTGLESQAVYNDMSNEYHQVKGYVSRLLGDMESLMERQHEIQNPDNADYETAALDDEIIAEAIRIMLDCYRIGNQSALDSVDDKILIGDRNMMDGVVEWKAIVEAQHSLFQSMQTIYSNMKAKFAEAEKLIDGDEEKKYTTYVEAIKKVLVAGYLVIPTFRPDANVPLEELAKQAEGNTFVNIDTMDLEAMIGDLALVEQPMMNLHQVRLFQKCNDMDVPDIVPMQITSSDSFASNTSLTTNQWLGTKVESEDDVKDAFTYIVMNPKHLADAAQESTPVLAGMIIDHWVERIPYRSQTAAVAFGYNQPDAEAPQTLLLAVAPKDNNKGWNEKMLVNSLKSAIHMVKCRTVSPDMLCKDGWASGLFPLLEYRDPYMPKEDVTSKTVGSKRNRIAKKHIEDNYE